MYGPPPDASEQLLDLSSLSWSWLVCVAIGLGITAIALYKRLPHWLRALTFVVGQVVALTSPFAALLRTHVLGSWPTVDKTGSLLFYTDGVHHRMLSAPVESLSDPAARLIGVHVGHLWLVEFFDLFVEPFAAYNLQAMLWIIIGWYGAALFVKEVGTGWRDALILGFPFGMGLHVFRDLNWYTVEKMAVGLLAIFAWTMIKCHKEGGRWCWAAALTFLGMAWVNWYLGLVGAVGGAMLLVMTRNKGVLRACVLCTVLSLPLVCWQLALLSGDETLGDPEVYLYERAMLDSFTLYPPTWNRLEAWRAINVPIVGLALFTFFRRGHRYVAALGLMGAVFFVIALGPKLTEDLWNPLYMALHAVVPGFWRVAKPEVFFEGTYLCLLGLAARAVDRPLPGWLYPLLVIGWLAVVRTHPAFPPVAEYQHYELSEDWMKRLPGDRR
ncbi:MAG TPA: hypothetical protein QGF58_04495 [Myxococcota bacterium]|nr:hypothetical protein [Myxococcota bacterium]